MRNKPKARRLPKNKMVRHPQYFMFVDTETLLEKKEDEKTIHHFRLGVSIHLRLRKDGREPKRKVLHFDNINVFWDACLSSLRGKNTLYLIAHNALFDMTILDWLTQLTKRGWECKFVFEQGVTFISKWQKDDQRIVILDNANWFKGKLSDWGNTLGLKKLNMPDFEEDDKTWYTYCQRDVEILEELQKWLIQFLTDNDLGNWKYTIAALSLSSYRHRFMTHPIYIPEQTRETHLARQAYRGGRTEVFQVGEFINGPYYKLDFNSMYPGVMAYNLYPSNVEGYKKKPSLGGVARNLENHLAVGMFRIRVDLPYYPYKLEGITIYPKGVFTTFLTTPEIKLALENDWLLECYEIAWYRPREIFTEFVEFFYNKRLEAKQKDDSLRSVLYKLFMNSLYGKFGQHRYEDKIIGKAPVGTWETSYLYNRVTGERGVVRQFGENIIRSTRKGEGYYAFPAICAHVTAYGRLLLYDTILLAGRENTLYTDTDSLIVNADGFRNLSDHISDTELGKLKIEGVSDYVQIKSPKHYTFGEEVKRKGVRKDSLQISERTWRMEVWPGLNRILQTGGTSYFNYSVDKTLNDRIRTGLVQNDGTIAPFEIME